MKHLINNLICLILLATTQWIQGQDLRVSTPVISSNVPGFPVNHVPFGGYEYQVTVILHLEGISFSDNLIPNAYLITNTFQPYEIGKYPTKVLKKKFSDNDYELTYTFATNSLVLTQNSVYSTDNFGGHIQIKADPNNLIAETDESNNQKLSSNYFTTVAALDFQIERLYVAQNTVKAGTPTEVTVYVDNNKYDTILRQGHHIEYYLAKDASGSESVFLGKFRSKAFFEDFNDFSSTATILIPQVPSGTYYLIAKVNPSKDIEEFNYDNNTRAISITVDQVTSINELGISETCNFYPNPSKGILYLQPRQEKPLFVEIYNTSNQKVHEEALNGNLLNIESLGSGIYIIKLIDGNGLTHIQKIVLDRD